MDYLRYHDLVFFKEKQKKLPKLEIRAMKTMNATKVKQDICSEFL